ncbi:DUF624 domain-containing protein [Clostridium frigoris]|uniref:DUF624 domain-containing protein n=1 Tax=Clostridium frigoris TaxID=205327 RepID=A0ABS6BQN2_9CLOT|nr:DUF624 domain-containing protein [Clostridium frigoris]MBU3158775.1 DUF624 domain-containing protein [Clostridium frigoris]
MAKSRKEFGEGPLYTITNYIFWFLLGNLYFLLLNIPLVLMLIILFSNGTNKIPQGFTSILVLCCIPIAPAATALFSVMGKIIREKDVSITKDYFKAYKTNFTQSLFFGALEIMIICILSIDIKYFITSAYPKVLTVSTFVIIVFVFSINLYIFPIISRFYLGWKDVLKTAMYFTIRKFNITLLCLSSFLIIGFIFFKVTTFILIFIPCIVCYLVMYYQKNILLEIENKIKQDTDKVQL